jgi:4-carboxymuconolactone decarboxylase
MVTEGYGKVLGRPALALDVRELCIVALLVAQDAPQQLYSHVRGALRVGNSAEDVKEAVRVAGTVAGPERASAAMQVYDMVRARYGAES